MRGGASNDQARAWVAALTLAHRQGLDRLASQAVDLRTPPPDWFEIEVVGP